MFKKLLILIAVLIGVAFGWIGNSLKDLYMNKQTDLSSVDADNVNGKVQNPGLSESFARRNPESEEPVDGKMSTVTDFFSRTSLLDNSQLGMLIELFKQDMDIEAQQQLNQDVVSYAVSLLEAKGKQRKTEERLLSLLGNFDTKEQILDILAQYYQGRRQFKQAISSLYNLRSLTRYDEEFQLVNDRISRLINENLSYLKKRNDKESTSEFYQFLIAKEPDNYQIQMQYAEFEYNNRRYDHSAELLGTLIHHPSFSTEASRLLEKTQKKQLMVEVGLRPAPLVKLGEHFLVNVRINEQVTVKLIIDTGASMTILSPEVIQMLNIGRDDVQEYRSFSTANGVVQAPVIELDKLSIQNNQVLDIQVAVLPSFSSNDADGLLGMNFLSEFVFFIDQNNLTLELVAFDQ